MERGIKRETILRTNNCIHGDFIDGTAILYEQTRNGIVKSLLFEDGSTFSMHRYSCTGDFHDGLAWYEQNGKMGYINRKGIEVIEPKFHIADDFNEERAYVLDSGQIMLIDKSGEQLALSSEIDFVSDFNNGIARVGKFSDKMNSRMDGFIDKDGKIIIPMKYKRNIASPMDLIDREDQFSEGLAKVSKNNKYGFIDINDNLVIDFQYDYVSRFTDGVAVARNNGKAGFINKKSEVVIPFDFLDAAFSFSGYYFVKDCNGWFILNKDKAELNGIYFKRLKHIKNGMIAVQHGNKWGVLDSKLNLVLPLISLKPPVYSEGLFRYIKQKAIVIRDLDGNELLIVGDGPVEIIEGRQRGAICLGVASDEIVRHGWNGHKVDRLIRAGVDILVPDFVHSLELIKLIVS